MRHLFIINPRSFSDKARMSGIKDEISRLFKDSTQYSIHISRYPRDAVGIVRKFAASHDGNVRVYAIGGDGILFDCLNGLVGYPDAELAAVPYGSTNDFARAISEGDITRLLQLDRLLHAPSVSTDIIHCGSNYAINFCSVGVESAAIAKWYNVQLKYFKPKSKRLVNLILTICGVLCVFDKKLVNQYYSVKIDGRGYDGHYAAINFSNGPCYGGDKSVAPEAIFNDGLMDVLLVKSTSRLRLLTIIPGYLRGRYAKYPETITHIRAKELAIHSEQPLFINLDGECFWDTGITLKIMPSAVKIIAAGGYSYQGARGNE